MSSKTTIQDLINTNLASSSDITASELRAVFNAFLNDSSILYEVKELDVNNAFITANFDGTGLGINSFEGWAICNGDNGTKDRGGRVSIAYDSVNYPTLGVVGGSEDAVVVEHSHTVANYAGNTLTSTRIDASTLIGIGGDTTSTTGVSGVGKNMQPYLVTLFIQRIA